MSLGLSESTTTWDVAPANLLQPIVREVRASYDVRVKSPLDFVSVLMQGTTSTDVRFLLGETGDPLWDASVETAIWSSEGRYRLPPRARPYQVEERGPFGGRLISLAEACKLADQIALEAERRRQEARERDALYWGDLENET
jgi:hypothetical protein